MPDLSSLKPTLSGDSQILTDPSEPLFQERLQRWTDIDKQVPSAIVLPISEEDILKTVQWTSQHSTPFVAKSGGHSAWSTIGDDGIIIDLSLYKGVQVDRGLKTATLRGSILQKEVAVYLAERGVFTALGNGNTVGMIPYFLNGGISITNPLTGFASDNIIAARLITARGTLITANETTNPDLLYAIRGAGQFFGLVTELTVRTYPLSLLGNPNGSIWMGTFVFPTARAREVCAVMNTIMNDERYSTSGLFMMASPPPVGKPALVVSAKLVGDPGEAEEAFKGLHALGPLAVKGGEVRIQNTSDALDAIGGKGDLKRFGIVGLDSFDTEAFLKMVKLYEEMVVECPDAAKSSLNVQWSSRPVKKPDFESAMAHHGVRFWQNNVIWHTDPHTRAKVDDYNQRAIAIMRNGQDGVDRVEYQNCTRDTPVQHRYPGTVRLAKLKELKKVWDPMGVFTREFRDS